MGKRAIFDGDVRTLRDLIQAVYETRSQFREIDTCVFIAQSSAVGRAKLEVTAQPGVFPGKHFGVQGPLITAEQHNQEGRLVLSVLEVKKSYPTYDRVMVDAKAVVLYAESSTLEVLDSRGKMIYELPLIHTITVDAAGSPT